MRTIASLLLVTLCTTASAASIELPVYTEPQPGQAYTHRVDVSGFDILGGTQVGLRAVRQQHLATRSNLPPTYTDLDSNGEASFWIHTPLTFADGPTYAKDVLLVYFQEVTPTGWVFFSVRDIGFHPNPLGNSSSLEVTGVEIQPPYYQNFQHARFDYTANGVELYAFLDVLQQVIPEPSGGAIFAILCSAVPFVRRNRSVA